MIDRFGYKNTNGSINYITYNHIIELLKKKFPDGFKSMEGSRFLKFELNVEYSAISEGVLFRRMFNKKYLEREEERAMDKNNGMINVRYFWKYRAIANIPTTKHKGEY